MRQNTVEENKIEINTQHSMDIPVYGDDYKHGRR